MKVLVADDHEFVRGGVVSELASIIPDASFLQAGNAKEVIDALEANPDIGLAILDLYMPGANRYDLIEIACHTYPELLVVVLTASENCNDMRAVIDRGAKGYIAKTSGKEIVRHAVQLVLAGGTYFPSEMMSASIEECSSEQALSALQNKITALTGRQKEVLEHLLSGCSNKKIANALNLSENTVKIHVTAILKALPFESRAQVIAGVVATDLTLMGHLR
jgi:DNA-binding NarL/FixJ family response regulator